MKNEMKLGDLQSGMVAQLRNGDFYRVMLGTKKGDLLINKRGGVVLAGTMLCEHGIEGYNDDLCMKNHQSDPEGMDEVHRQFDIMKVWEPDSTLLGLTKIDFEHLELIYDRNIKTIHVWFQSYRDYVGGQEMEYIENADGSINLVGKLFGIENTHIPKHYIDYKDGIPESTTICVHDGKPNRIK